MPEVHRQSLWFSASKRQRARAKRLCSTCPLLDACHDWALHNMIIQTAGPRTYFVVGGKTEQELYNERRRLKIIPPRAPHGPVTGIKRKQA